MVLTGHAFQVFLNQDDQRAAISTIAAHLAPQGRFVFDTRNPLDDDWRTWTPDETRRTIEHREYGAVETWNDVSRDDAAGIVSYETHYRIERDGSHFSAASRIAFPGRDQVAALLEDAGLVVDAWMGDWLGAPCNAASPDIIPVGRIG